MKVLKPNQDLLFVCVHCADGFSNFWLRFCGREGKPEVYSDTAFG
jgi:hypothetical protein